MIEAPLGTRDHRSGSTWLALSIGLALFAGGWVVWLKLQKERPTSVHLFASKGRSVGYALDGNIQIILAEGMQTVVVSPGTHVWEFFEDGNPIGRTELRFPRDATAMVLPIPGQCFGLFRRNESSPKSTLNAPFDLESTMYFDQLNMPPDLPQHREDDRRNNAVVKEMPCGGPPPGWVPVKK